jgi:rod shape-determining protein MreC
LSIVLMAVDHRQNHVEAIRSAISVVIYPIQYLVNLPVAVGEWMGESVSSREYLMEENERLRMQQLLFKAQLQKLAALRIENERLRELLQSSKKVGENVLIAELLAIDLDPFSRQIVINKGSNDNVYLGQPVLDAEGIMGQVVHVGPFSATVMLITDPNHAIPVHVNRNGLRAIALGTGAPDVLEIPYLPNSADIVVGDLLTSSGLGGRFPRDYPVARITEVKITPTQPYATVTAEPIALLERSREVLLVWPGDQTSADLAELQTITDVSGKPPTPAEGTEPPGSPVSPPGELQNPDRNAPPGAENVPVEQTTPPPATRSTPVQPVAPAAAAQGSPDAGPPATASQPKEETE